MHALGAGPADDLRDALSFNSLSAVQKSCTSQYQANTAPWNQCVTVRLSRAEALRFDNVALWVKWVLPSLAMGAAAGYFAKKYWVR